RAGGLPEHEVPGGLRLREPGHRRDDVLVPIQDQQVVGGGDLGGVHERTEVGEREHRAAVLRVRGLEEVHVPLVVRYTFSRYEAGLVTALKMFGSKSGSSEKVLAKQPFSEP